MLTLILKLSCLNIVHRVFVVLIAGAICLRAGVTVFVSTVCMLDSCFILCHKLTSPNCWALACTKVTFHSFIHPSMKDVMTTLRTDCPWNEREMQFVLSHRMLLNWWKQIHLLLVELAELRSWLLDKWFCLPQNQQLSTKTCNMSRRPFDQNQVYLHNTNPFS